MLVFQALSNGPIRIYLKSPLKIKFRVIKCSVVLLVGRSVNSDESEGRVGILVSARFRHRIEIQTGFQEL